MTDQTPVAPALRHAPPTAGRPAAWRGAPRATIRMAWLAGLLLAGILPSLAAAARPSVNGVPGPGTAQAAAPPPTDPGGQPGQPGQPEGEPVDDRVTATLSAIGLEVRFPAGTTIAPQETPNGPAITALDGGRPPAWSILIQPIPTSVSPPVARTQLEAITSTQRSAAGPLELRVDRRVVAGGVLGHLAILRDPADRLDRFVGMAVFPRNAEGRGMVLVSARGIDEDRLTRAMEDLLASVRLRGPQAISTERGARLERGATALAAMDRDTLTQLVGRQQWYRTYRLDDSGREVEVGCMFVEVAEGLRGMVDPNRDPARYSMAEREPGFMVRVAARFPVSDGILRSSQAVHWMAWDQSSEQWSVRATMRDGRRTNSEALTGIRAARSGANPRGSIHLVTARERGVTDPPAFWDVPEVLLSQPVRWLLGDLLVQADVAPGVLAWYAIDASDGRPDLAYREDTWRRDPDGPGWILETRATPTSSPIVSRHAVDGRLLDRLTPEGIRTEPIELSELRRLWASKGLPTGPLKTTP